MALVLLGLLVGLPALALSLVSMQPLPRDSLIVAVTELADTKGAPCNRAAPEPGLPCCPVSAIGCVALGLPSVGPSVPLAPHGVAWDARPPGIGPGLPVAPPLFPPILPA